MYSDVSRLSLEMQYITVCPGMWPEHLKEMLLWKYIMGLQVAEVWLLHQIWKVKEESYENPSLIWKIRITLQLCGFFLWNIFTKNINYANEKQE